ncbi:DNA topoisomerase, partial [Mycobacterium tuberculosis]
QSLYTKGFLSYPRSDSQYLTENEARELPAILQKLRNKAEYQNLIPTPKSSIEQDKRYTNASKVSDHHAIIVTEQIPSNLADDEQKIYDLVARSVIAAFYEDAIFDHTHIVTQVESFS